MNAHARIDPAPLPANGAGRVCPIDYTYSPAVFRRPADLAAETIYVIGGLYGNLPALRDIERMAAAEPGDVTLVFNGDYHWFDAEPDWFAEIERGVAPHVAMRGNIESEIAREDDVGAGCGCAYPPDVAEAIVTRSNDILAQLRGVVGADDRKTLAKLPMHLVAQVGRLSIGIVHGDAGALAGWRFAHDMLDDPARRPWLNDIRHRSGVDVFASTHTCLAALRDYRLPAGRMTVINNGAAGMPNFSGSRHGVLSRISLAPSPYRPLYGLVRDGVHIDALPVGYDTEAFLARFLRRWPAGSPAHASYHSRIVNGPDFPVVRAAG